MLVMLAALTMQPVPAEVRSEVRGRLIIPDEIGPAIAPYVRCRIASAGIEIRSSMDGPVERPAAAVGADCAQVRRQAAERAQQMLRNRRGGTEADRRALVERTLTSVDNFVPVSAAPQPAQPSSPEE